MGKQTGFLEFPRENPPHRAVAEHFEQRAQIEQLEHYYEEAILANAAVELVKSKPMINLAPQFAEQLPAE